MKEIQKQSKHHQPRVGLFVGVAALAGLLANGVPARSDFVEQFKFSGGIVIALDFNDGESIAELATEVSLNPNFDEVSEPEP